MGYFRRWRKTSVAELRKMVVAEKFFRAIAVAFFVFQKTPKIALFRVPACRQGGVNCWVSDYPLYIQYEVDPQKTSLLASKFPKFSQQNPNTDVFNFFSSPKIDFPDFLEQLPISTWHNFYDFPYKTLALRNVKVWKFARHAKFIKIDQNYVDKICNDAIKMFAITTTFRQHFVNISSTSTKHDQQISSFLQ